MHTYDYVKCILRWWKKPTGITGHNALYHVTFVHMKYKFFRRTDYQKLSSLVRLRKYCFWIYTAYKPNKRYVGVTWSPIPERQKLGKADWLDDWSLRRRDVPSNSLCGMLSGRNLWNNFLILTLVSKHRLNWVELTYFFITLKYHFVHL